MEFWTNIFLLFATILFYVHLQFQYKKKEDLEIYEMDYLSNANLQEVTDLKQPVFFSLEGTDSLFAALHPDLQEEVVVKDVGDYHRSSSLSREKDGKDVIKETAVIGIALSFSSAYGLMDSDPKHVFYSENNGTFLEETDILSSFQKFASKIGTSWSVQNRYDLLFGSPKVTMPWKFHTSSQRFLVVSPGAGVRVKMTPWKSRKYMDVVYDYEAFDFWARSVQETNMKCLDFDLKPGQVLYIPPYWFYSVEFLSEGPPTNHTDRTNQSQISFLASFTFVTPMNTIANLDHYGYAFFQQTSSASMIKTIVPFSSTHKREEEVQEEDEEDEEEEMPKDPVLSEENTNVAKIEIQEMLSVIEKPKISENLDSDQHQDPDPEN
jgi:hypothetical protein